MFSGLAWWSRNESGESSFHFNDNHNQPHEEATAVEDELDEYRPTPAIIQRRDETIEIDISTYTYSVAFLAGGKHIVSMDKDDKIRRWQAEDGTEVGTPVCINNNRSNLAVSQDGKWVVCGSWTGTVTVWDAESQKRVTEFKTESRDVCVVDISPDATEIVTTSTERAAWVWSLPTGRRLLGPLRHESYVSGVKFSPNGRRFATASQDRDSIRIYNSRNGLLLKDFPVQVNPSFNQSLAWANDSKQLFALSLDNHIYCLDTHKTTFSRWPVHNGDSARCIALAGNGMFVAASAGPLLSFWDTTTHQQIGSVIEYNHDILSMAISAKYDIAVGGEIITLRTLWGILPTPYADVMFPERAVPRIKAEKVELEETIRSLRAQEEGLNIKIAHLEDTILGLCHELTESDQEKRTLVQSLRTQEESSHTKIQLLEMAAQELRNKLANSQHAANQQKDGLNETIRSLRADLETQTRNSTSLQKTIQELYAEINKSQRKADQEKDNLNTSIKSPRPDLRAWDENSNIKIAQLDAIVQKLCTQLDLNSRHTAG